MRATKMKKIVSFVLCLALLLSAGGMQNVKAVESTGGTEKVKISVTYGQTEAREMLEMINAFRASETEAWAWNETNTEKVQPESVNPALHFQFQSQYLCCFAEHLRNSSI